MTTTTDTCKDPITAKEGNVTSTDEIRWTHAGTEVFAFVDRFTIRDCIISNPKTETRFTVYEQIDGDEVYLGTAATIGGALAIIANAEEAGS